MNNFVFIIPRTPSLFRNYIRNNLWNDTLASLKNQSYSNWAALIVDDHDMIEDKFHYINAPAQKKGEKIQYALKIIQSWKTKPDYIIRLDDDDLISPLALESVSKSNFDVAIDKYHTFHEVKSGLFCQSKKPWFANTVIHKYEHASKILSDGRPLLDQNHSQVWHQYYDNKEVFTFSKGQPLYCRILSPSTITSRADENYLNYVHSFGWWNKNEELKKLFKVEEDTFFNPTFRLKTMFNYMYVFKRIKSKLYT